MRSKRLFLVVAALAFSSACYGKKVLVVHQHLDLDDLTVAVNPEFCLKPQPETLSGIPAEIYCAKRHQQKITSLQVLKVATGLYTNLSNQVALTAQQELAEPEVTTLVKPISAVVLKDDWQSFDFMAVYLPKPPLLRPRLLVDALIKKAGKTLQLPLWFEVQRFGKAWVATSDIAPKQLIVKEQITQQRISLLESGCTPITKLPLEAIRSTKVIEQGQPLCRQNTQKLPLVDEGQRVAMLLAGEGLALQTTVITQQSGELGDHIQVKKLDGRTLYLAKVIGNGRVQYEKNM